MSSHFSSFKVLISADAQERSSTMMTRDMFEQMFPAKAFNENGEVIRTQAAFDRFAAKADELELKLLTSKKDDTYFGVCPKEVEKPKKSDLIGVIRLKPQVHTSTLRDISFWSEKRGKYGVKALTHQGKKGVEYRCFISYKDEAGKLRRYRINNATTKKLSNKKDEFLKYVQNLTEKDIEKELTA